MQIQIEKKKNSLFTQGVSYVVWKTIVNIFSLYAIVQVSLALFDEQSYKFQNKGTIFLLIRLLIIIVLFADIFIKFNVQQIIDKNVIINKNNEFSKKYLLFIFWFDFLPAFFVLFQTLFYLPNYIAVLIFLKVISLIDADTYTQQQLLHHASIYFVYKVLRLIVILLFVFNCFGCLFYLMGLIGLDSDEQTWLDFSKSYSGIIVKDQTRNTKYIISTYWAVETLTSIGFGDITPVNTYEIFITDLALFGQMFVIVYTVSYIVSLQDQKNPYDKNMHAIKKFMKIKNISSDIVNQVSIFLEQYFYDYKRRDQKSEQDVMRKLTKHLQSKLLYQAYQNQLLKIEWLFNRFSLQCLQDIACKIKELCLGADQIIEQDIYDPKLYIVVNGKINLSLNGVLIKSIEKGGSFGNYEFVTGIRQKSKVAKTETYAILYYISRQDMIQCLQNSFEDYQKFQEIYDQVIYEKKLETIGLYCLLCKSTCHLTQQCQQINIKEMIQDFDQVTIQQRQKFKRSSKRHDTQNAPKDFLQYKFDLKMDYQNLDIDQKCQAYKKMQFIPFVMRMEKTKVDPLRIIRDVIDEANQKKEFKILRALPIINCSSSFVDIWNYFIFINTLILFTLVPLIIFFYIDYDSFKMNPFFKGMRYYYMAILFLDVILKFNINYYFFGALITSRKQIGMRYLSSYFVFDMIPVLILLYFDFIYTYTIVYLLILFKAVSFFQIEKQIQERLKLYPSKYNTYLIFKMFIEVLYLQHFWACMYFAGGEYMYYNYPGIKTWLNDPKSHFGSIITLHYSKQYLVSYYWAVNVITTVGYGDIYPLNNMEWFINDLALISAIMIAAINITNIAFIRASSNQKEQLKNKIAISAFMRQNLISKQTRNFILKYLLNSEIFYDYRNTELEFQTFGMLPKSLKTKLMDQAYSSVYTNLWLNVFDREIIAQIAQETKEAFFSAHENIFLDNVFDNDCSLYFIEKGCVQLFFNLPISNKEETLIAKLKSKESFGHYSFVTGMKRQASARSYKHALLIYLERNNFLKALQHNLKQVALFEQIKYEVLFLNKLQHFKIKCYTCQSSEHMSISCPLTQIKQNILLTFKPKEKMKFIQQREYLKRNKKTKTQRFNQEIDKQFIKNSNKRPFKEVFQQVNLIIDESNQM
ncbi:unnamed protein product [Paramecium pentaurelia]|uniref:Cyclic nucleotide-binding domain-containing protein n=1 Tax=Paramecium pentaurelia TaxID=43138 RepID=A0A8S1S6T9_9CILI|nr:unnamed protein product [Paramecium pentaurelia]